MRGERIIYHGSRAALRRDDYCYVLTVGNSGPFYYGTPAGLLAGIEEHCRGIGFADLADLRAAAGKFIRREQAREAARAFGRRI